MHETRRTLLAVAVVAGLQLAATLPTAALTIDLDFIDSSPFATNATARSTIEKAAADISAAITSALSPVNQHVWNRDITSGSQTFRSTYTWHFSYSNLSGGSTQVVPSLPANTVTMFVRGQSLSGSTLGTGGSAGIGFNANYGITFSGSINQVTLQNQFNQAVAFHENVAEAEFTRGAGPVISTLEGITSVNFSGVGASAPYSVSYGPAYGMLSLDTSTGSTSFNNYWHLDYATNVAAGKNDLYSVALHEMLHAIGYGSSETWNDLRSGTSWNGPHAIAEFGTGSGLVTTEGHIASGKMSRRITDGAMQEAVMDPSLTTGQRKYLTTLDLAFLRDLGYSTIVPDFGIDGDFNGDGLVNLADYNVWRDNLGASTELAINNNGNGGGITSADYLVWKNNFAQPAAAIVITTVPEPRTAILLLLLGLGLMFAFRTRDQRWHRGQIGRA